MCRLRVKRTFWHVLYVVTLTTKKKIVYVFVSSLLFMFFIFFPLYFFSLLHCGILECGKCKIHIDSDKRNAVVLKNTLKIYKRGLLVAFYVLECIFIQFFMLFIHIYWQKNVNKCTSKKESYSFRLKYPSHFVT